MSLRRSLSLPIALGVAMITGVVVLGVGWVVLALFGALTAERLTVLYWALLPVGATFLMLLLAGVVVYLILSIKAISLSRRQSNFIDSVTHELKSPLASMKLCLQTLSRRQLAAEEQAAFYRFMLDDVERLDRLTSQILEAARLEGRRGIGPAEHVPLAPLLRKCAEAVCASYRVPGEIIRWALKPLVVSAARADLELIFRNLIDNAVKYAGPEPEVAVVLRPAAEGRVVVEISDNGPGIAPRLRRRIFGRFVRLGTELERRKPGTGLGLYIVQTLVRRWGGRIRVKDRIPPPGTVFEVQLPAASADAAADISPPDANHDARPCAAPEAAADSSGAEARHGALSDAPLRPTPAAPP